MIIIKKVGEAFTKIKGEEDSEVNEEVEEMEKENEEEEERIKKEKEELQAKLKKEQEEKIQKEIEEKKKREREEEELTKYLKMNYFLENKLIRNVKDKKEELIKPLYSNGPTEATLVDQMKNLDKQQIPKM